MPAAPPILRSSIDDTPPLVVRLTSTPTASEMHAVSPRVRRLLLSLIAILALAVAALCFTPSAPLQPVRLTLPIDWWDWGRREPLSDSEIEAAEAAAQRGGVLVVRAGRGRRRPSDLVAPRPRFRCPPDLAHHLVVRLDAPVARAMSPAGNRDLAQLVLAGFSKPLRSRIAGLQIGRRCADQAAARLRGVPQAPARRLPARLPAVRLTIAARLGGSVDLPAVMAAVDCIVPQFYATCPLRPQRRNGWWPAAELAPVIRRLESSAARTGIGLPNLRAMLAVQRGREPAAAMLPLAVESALAAGAQVRHAVAGRRAHRRTRLSRTASPFAGVRLAAAAGWRSASDAGGLGRQLQTVQRLAGAHCLGICLFRLPDGPPPHPVPGQVAAAAAGRSGRRNSRRWRVPMATAGR